jgi:hypothetical protein
MAHKATVKAAIQYPTWKVRGNPSPNERLVICDECGHAEWTTSNTQGVRICYNRHGHANGKNGRMRTATAQETAIGKSTIKEIIG